MTQSLRIRTVSALCIFTFSASLLATEAQSAPPSRQTHTLEPFLLWDPAVPLPSPESLSYPKKAFDTVVHRADQEFGFLHDNAVAWYGNTLFAGWYNCPKAEIQDASCIRCRRTLDHGRTWSKAEVIAADHAGQGIFYVPLVFFAHKGRLLAFVSNMTGHDLVTRCEAFLLESAGNRWVSQGFIAGPLPPKLPPAPDGRWKLHHGRTHGGPARHQARNARRRHFFRTKRHRALESGSHDARLLPPAHRLSGKHTLAPTAPKSPPSCAAAWSSPAQTTDVPGRAPSSTISPRKTANPSPSNSAPVSDASCGTVRNRRKPTAACSPSPSAGPEKKTSLPCGKSAKENRTHWTPVPEWSYPSAVEHEGALYVVYTSEKRHSVMTVIPIESLRVDTAH